MELKTSKKEIKLVFRTRKIVDIANKLQAKNFEEGFFGAMNSLDLDALSKIIYTLAENDEGKKSFVTSSEVYDFIDDYKAENEKTYKDIFNELAEAINKEGFFNKKMTKTELSERTDSLMSSINSIDMKEVVQKAVEKIVEKETTDTFQGYKG